MRKLLAFLISIYQKRLSPHKGFSCAHSGLHKGDSCSEYTKKQILDKGVFASLRAIRQRFNECGEAAQTIKQRPPLAQRGDCDCGLSAFDLSACDSCEIGDKGSLALDCCSSCDIFHSDKKNRTRDLWVLAFIIIAIILVVSYFVFK